MPTSNASPAVQPTGRFAQLYARLRNHVGQMLMLVVVSASVGSLSLVEMRNACLDATPSASARVPLLQRGTSRLAVAGTPVAAKLVLADWRARCAAGGSDWREAPKHNLWWDFLFIPAYVVLLAMLALLASRLTSSALLTALSRALLVLIFVAGMMDIGENVVLLNIIKNGPGPTAVQVARILSFAKLLLLAGPMVFIVATPLQWLTNVLRGKAGQSALNYSEKFSGAKHDSLPTPAAALPGAIGPATQLDAVRQQELDYLRHHRYAGSTDPSIGHGLVGLALSGGGIRSATTNLGMLQALGELGVLPFVDYLCTVSGGGYIGACLSTLLSLRTPLPWAPTPDAAGESHLFGPGAKPAFSTRWGSFPFRDDFAGTAARRANALIAHLRTHGNFLIARHGMLKRDALRAVGSIATGIVYNILGFVLILVAVSAVYLAVVELLAPNLSNGLGPLPTATYTRPGNGAPAPGSSPVAVRHIAADCAPKDANCQVRSTEVLEPPALRDWIARNLAIALDPVRAAFSDRSRSWPVSRGISLAELYGAAFASGVLVAICAWLLIWRGRDLFTDKDEPEPIAGEASDEAFERAMLQAVAVMTVLWVVITIVSLRILVMPGSEELSLLWVPLVIILGARVASVVLGIGMQWSSEWNRAFRSQWSAYQAMMIYGLWLSAGFIILAPLIFAFAGNRVGASVSTIGALGVARYLTPAHRSGSQRTRRIPPGLLHMLLAIAVFFVIALGLVAAGAFLVSTEATQNFVAVAFAAAIVFLILGAIVDQNKLSLHFFYRDRLAETYLLSEMPDRAHRQWVFRDAIEMPLHELHGQFRSDVREGRNPAPYHLISAAINLAGSRDLTRKDRKSGYFLFSKLYCGSTHTGFRPTARYSRGFTKVARAIAISGAAASSGIGYMTFFAQSFATVLFNVRLGYWIENPRLARSANQHEAFIYWPAYLLREVLMNTTEHSPLVNVSDGGHTGDNIGVYPLLQRRCRVIIACDAEQDPALSFGSFTESLRQAYIDDGIAVDIDLSMIRPDPVTQMSRAHCAVGRIRYPDRPEQESYLVYLKNSITGDEPEPVLNYRVTSPDFPHESTADLFFSDAQFESYRALGVHIAKSTFNTWAASLPPLGAVP